MAVPTAHLICVFLLTYSSALHLAGCLETSVTEGVLLSPAPVSFTALTSVQFTANVLNLSSDNQRTTVEAQQSTVYTVDTPTLVPEPTGMNSISSGSGDELSAIVDTPTLVPEPTGVNSISLGSGDELSAIVDTPTPVPEPTDESGSSGSSDKLSTAAIAGIVVGTVIGVIGVMALVIVGVVIVARKRISTRNQRSWTPGLQALDNPSYSPSNTNPWANPRSFVNPNYACADSVLHENQMSYEIPQRQGNEYQYFEYSWLSGSVPTLEQRAEYEYRSSFIYSSPQKNHKECDDQTTYFAEQEVYWAPASSYEGLYEQLSRYRYREIPRPQLSLLEELGSGQFGIVHKGLWATEARSIKVAVKTLQSRATEADRVKFLQEAAIMGQFHHPNIVALLGVVTLGEPMIVLELLESGDLRSYLLKLDRSPDELLPPSTSQMCLDFCRQIASGMEYLSKKAFVHRDLAARNILVSDQRTCKIADFGLARDLADENYYVSHGGQVPVKWTAPEALNYKKYSTASDVWSYGAVMYEIWGLGHKPFKEFTNMQVIRMVSGGYRLPPPPGCPMALYELMIHCWHPEHRHRPSFSDLLQSLSRPETELLHWTEEDKKTHPQAAVLGASLEAGKDLYPELQCAYTET